MGTKIALLAAAIMAAPLAANAALVSTDGGLGVYDTTNNVTWTSNANLMATQAANFNGGAGAFISTLIADSGGVIHDTPNSLDPGNYSLSASDFNTSTGAMDYWGAQAWVNYLDVTNYGGSNKWALPTTASSGAIYGYPKGSAGDPAQSSSQLAQLFYGNLNQQQNQSINAVHNGYYVLFNNLQSGTYWSGTEYALDASAASELDSSNGIQGAYTKSYNLGYALAVSPGQVSPVPLPAAAWLMLSGLGGIGALARKKRSV